MDADKQLVPLLAESWQTSDDGKAITMKLKTGVTFQDGMPFNAEAVRFKETGTKSPIYDGVKQIEDIKCLMIKASLYVQRTGGKLLEHPHHAVRRYH